MKNWLDDQSEQTAGCGLSAARILTTFFISHFLPTAFWITATYSLLFSATNSLN